MPSEALIRSSISSFDPKLSSCDATDIRLFRGRDMVCFSHDWNGDPLSKTHLMRLLAKENRVLWVNSIGYRTPTVSAHDARRVLRKLKAAVTPISEPETNIFVMSPLILPVFGNRAIAGVNRFILRAQIRRVMRKLNFRRVINWVFNPAAANVAGELNEDCLIYYCVDEYGSFSGVQSAALHALETEVLKKADVVITSSERLQVSKSRFNKNTFLVRHGVDFEHFRRALEPELPIPEDVRGLSGPIIGYFGLLADDWVDLPLLVHTAKSFPEATLVLLGKSTMDLTPLTDLPNVRYLGRKPYESLPNYCRAFRVGLVPFPINDVTLNANPLKAREYLAAGLPVVATNIPEVTAIGDCRVADDRNRFVEEIRAAIHDPTLPAVRSERMRTHDWTSRLREVERNVQRVVGP